VKSRAITFSEFEVGSDVYDITVREYNTPLDHFTADWVRVSDRLKGKLGYGVPSCTWAIKLAEEAILNQIQYGEFGSDGALRPMHLKSA